MKVIQTSFAGLSDNELLTATHRLAECERHATAELVAVLMEVDARQLFLGQGYPSLFVYCTDLLRLSEHAAYGRIQAARAARRIPALLDGLVDGSLTLTTACLLAPHLTGENHAELLELARRQSKRDVERLVAALRPLPAVRSSIRALSEPRRGVPPTGTAPPPMDVIAHAPRPPSGAPAREVNEASAICVTATTSESPAPLRAQPAVVKPLAPERYRVQVTISREAHDNLRRAQDLLRHTIPTGDPAAILERALALLVEDLERTTCAAAKRPRPSGTATPGSRHIPAAVKRKVWTRDQGRCAFVGTLGRCSERGFLELHHVVPFADGGPSDATNLQLRCRAHNAFEAEQWFGSSTARELSPVYADSVRPEVLPNRQSAIGNRQ